jgi:hypothetical protein
LNDHLAGSVAALELVDRLIATYKGKPLEQFFKDLRSEIDADQRELQDLIEALGEKESPVRKAGLWMAEKFSRAGSHPKVYGSRPFRRPPAHPLTGERAAPDKKKEACRKIRVRAASQRRIWVDE